MSNSRQQDKFVLRLPDGLRPDIAYTARLNQRSMNGEIIFRLERSLLVERLHQQQGDVIAQLLKHIKTLEDQANPTPQEAGE